MNLTKKKISRDGKIMMLAYDQGFEHGPEDFNHKNVDPEHIFQIAGEGNYTALAVHVGIAKKYAHGPYRHIPLVIKLNGKTKFDNEDPVSYQHTSVNYAKELGAVGVGYTIYLGSSKEQEMFVEFSKICEEAHRLGLQAICWMYPRGTNIKDEMSTETIAYGARIAMELGADVVKLKYNGDKEGFKWVVANAGKTKVIIAGGSKKDSLDFLKDVDNSIDSGGVGVAVGRNAWQSDEPLEISEKLKKVIFERKFPEELEHLSKKSK